MVLFRLNVLNFFYCDDCMVVNSSSSAYSKLDDYLLWHARLGHVNFRRMHEMSKYGIILPFGINDKECKTCMLMKITNLFQMLLENQMFWNWFTMIFCDFHATPILGNKKYVITFIDDSSRFCYVYLLHSKDEAL